MADRSRDEKLAAAKKRLKKFQQKTDKGKPKKPKSCEGIDEKPGKEVEVHSSTNGSITFNDTVEAGGGDFSFEVGQRSVHDELIQTPDASLRVESSLTADENISPHLPTIDQLDTSHPVSEVGGDGQFVSGRPTASTERIMQLSRHLNGIINDSDISTDRSQSESTEATIRDLETRNVELAALLEKRNHANEQLTVQISQLREYNQRLQTQIADERATMESSLQRELSHAREQVAAHLQTIGILVAEKSELQSQLSHSQKQAQQRLQEMEEVSSRLRSARSRVDELEASVTSGRESSAAVESQRRELRRELDRCRNELRETQLARDEVLQVREELQQRLQARSQECTALERSRDELRKQIELSQIYVEQLSSSRDSANEEAMSQVRSLEAEKSQLQNRVEELDAAVNQLTEERDRLASQYREYIQQLQGQAQQLSQQLTKLTEERDTLRSQCLELQGLENASRQRENRLREEMNALKSRDSAEASASVDSTDQQALLDELRQLEKEKSVLECTLTEVRNHESVLKAQLEEAATSNRRLNALLEERELERLSLAERLEQAQEDRVNKLQILEEMQSDKTALSRALAQNKDMKAQIVELENRFIKMTNEQMEVTTQLQHEQHVSKELATRLQQQETELNEVRQLLSTKEEELRGLKQSYYTVTQQMFDVEGSEERKRAMQAQTQLAEKLQKELTSAQDTINNLTSQNSELRTLVYQAQAAMSEDKKARPRQTSISETSPPPTPRTDDPGQQVSALQASVAQLQMERDQLLTECQAASAETAELRLEVENLRPAVHEGRVVTAERFGELQEAQEQLEEKFNRAMERQAHLSEQNDYLEHLVMQLEGETATIGDYISIYQQQRQALLEREKLKSRDVKFLESERQLLRNKLSHLQTLVLRLLQEKEGSAQLTEYLTSLGPPTEHDVQPNDDWPSISSSSDDEDDDINNLPNSHDRSELSVHSSSIKKSDSCHSSPQTRGIPKDHTAQEIIHLISELGVTQDSSGLSSSLMNLNQDINYFRPCKCCTGKLQLV